VRAYKPLSQKEKPVERRAAAGGHDIDWMRRQRLDSGVADRDRRLGDSRRLAQEGAFARIALDQLDTWHAEDRQHQPRKPGAAAEIYEAPCSLGDERQELSRIEKVPPPRIAQRFASDQVDALVPLRQERGIGFKPRQCFT